MHKYHLCDGHTSQQVRLYCCDCDKLLCKLCLDTHADHTYLILTDIFNNLKRSTKAVSRDLDKWIHQLSEVIEVFDVQLGDAKTGSNRNDVIDIKKHFKLRTKDLQHCLKDATVQMKILLENKMFLIVFLRRWIYIKQIIMDANEKVTLLKTEAKQISVDGDINLQKALQLFVNLDCVTQFVSDTKTDSSMATNATNSQNTHRTESIEEITHNAENVCALKDGNPSDKFSGSRMVASDVKTNRFTVTSSDIEPNKTNDIDNCIPVSKTPSDDTKYTSTDMEVDKIKRYDLKSPTEMQSPEFKIEDRVHIHNNDKTKTKAEISDIPINVSSMVSCSNETTGAIDSYILKSLNSDTVKQNVTPFGSPPKSEDMNEITEKMSNVTLGRMADDKRDKCETKSDLVRNLMEDGQLQPCVSRLCQKTIVECSVVKQKLKQLQKRLDSTVKDLEVLTEEKRSMKMISSGMLQCLSNMNRVADFKGEWRICMDRTQSVDVNTFLENMEAVIDIVKSSKQERINAVQNLKDNSAFYNERANTQLIAERKLRDEHKAELKRKQEEIDQSANIIAAQAAKIFEIQGQPPGANSKYNYLLQEYNQLQNVFQETVQYKAQEVWKLEKTVHQQKEEIEELKIIHERLSRKTSEKDIVIKNLESDKNDLQLRLSSMAGDQLTKGNPTLTNLNDPNRPIKIGDQFKDIYDNEWTDAIECSQTAKSLFPELQPSEIEEITIQHLYQIVKMCYKECLVTAETQMKTFESSICSIFQFESEKEKTNIDTLPGITELLQLRRDNAEHYASKLKQILIDRIDLEDWQYPNKNKEVIHLLLTTPFFNRCVTQCWHMAIQDPPMHLDDELKSGTTFDKTQYREFTSSGDKVRYVVWPALYLHKDGPLLCKGVVQAYV